MTDNEKPSSETLKFQQKCLSKGVVIAVSQRLSWLFAQHAPVG